LSRRTAALTARSLLALQQLTVEMGSADQRLAPLLEHALLDALTISIGARIDLAGHLEPDKVTNLLIGDLLLDHLSAPIRIGAEEVDGVN